MTKPLAIRIYGAAGGQGSHRLKDPPEAVATYDRHHDEHRRRACYTTAPGKEIGPCSGAVATGCTASHYAVALSVISVLGDCAPVPTAIIERVDSRLLDETLFGSLAQHG